MNFFLKPRLGRISLMLIIGYFLSFLVFYIPNYIMESAPMSLTYFRLFFGELVSFIAISLAVVFLYHIHLTGKSLVTMSLSALALAATGCIYNLPYYYLYETALGNDWIESTLSSMLICLLIVVIDLLKMLLFTHIAVMMSSVFSKKKVRSEHSELILAGNGGGIMMLEAPEQRSFFAVSVVIFIYNIIFEIADVVNHLTQYGSFRDSELIFIVSKFIFLVVLMVLCYILQCLLYNCYRKAYKDDKKV